MKLMKVIVLAGGVFAGITACIGLQRENRTEKLQGQGTNGGFAVVELFTSEGCSSCPPADAVLESIQREYRSKEVYALAFHVDYWDHQGWKDRFSTRAFTDRQRAYAEWLNQHALYTPQLVVNGVSEYVGSNRGAIEKAISTGLDQAPAPPLTLQGTVGNGKVAVAFQYEGAVGEEDAELVLALVQQSAQSNVRAGENSGRQLLHAQVVRQMARLALGARHENMVALNLPIDFNKKGWELIGFVQRQSDGRIVAAGRFDFDAAPLSRIDFK